jgi:prevent-host-death family protein
MRPLERPIPLPAAEAGPRLRELVEQVVQNSGTTVLIGSGSREKAVLVDARHYELLVYRAELLRDRAGEPFRVAGSIEITCSDEELEEGIAENRRRQAELFEAKMRRWMED